MTSLPLLNGYHFLTAKGCSRLQALYSATQALRLERLAEARNKAPNKGVGDGVRWVKFFCEVGGRVF